MKLHLLRCGPKLFGFTLIFRRGYHFLGLKEAGPEKAPISAPFWRICDTCTVNEAMVFCETHSKYLCEFCLALHNNSPVLCSYLSMAAAREKLVQRVKNEAHT
jgi:hypothetical protein